MGYARQAFMIGTDINRKFIYDKSVIVKVFILPTLIFNNQVAVESRNLLILVKILII